LKKLPLSGKLTKALLSLLAPLSIPALLAALHVEVVELRRGLHRVLLLAILRIGALLSVLGLRLLRGL
jgi:hypothetical protein